MRKDHKDRLDKIYQNMRANMAKVDLLSIYSHESIADFPRSLPKASWDRLKVDIPTLNEVQKQISKEQFNLLTVEQYEKLGLSKESHRFIENVSILQTIPVG